MEPDITINGQKLSDGAVTTIHVALEHYAIFLKDEGLGEDAHGKFMTDAYLRQIKHMRDLMYPAEQAMEVV